MVKKILLTPFQKFARLGSLSGMLLFGTTIAALIWANSPYGHYYESLRHLETGISFHNFELKKPLILWINDGLMAIFFFLIGLELKRELLTGEINTLKKAAFPLMAALGGIVIPITLYLLLNKNPETAKGWGIPMATDIAFALAILSLLGKRVPVSIKIFLTAFAIIDDIAAVLVIAVFYSTSINWLFILYALIIIAGLALLYNKYKYSREVGIVLGIVTWFLFLKSGIHPTIAGVLLAFTIPLRRKIDTKSFLKHLSVISDNILKTSEKNKNRGFLDKKEMKYIDNLDDLSCAVRSPLQHLEYKLHNWSAYFILPVFALFNAGVVISSDYNFDFSLITNIIISLPVGKFIGVALFSYISIKLKIADLPSGVNFKQILGVAAVAGVGFTMSIFIANLGFQDGIVSINSAKVGIILGSLIAGISGYLILRFSAKK